MYTKNKNKVFLILILISIIFSIYFAYQRSKIEKDYKNYEILADYNIFSKLSDTQNMDNKEYFESLNKNGVSTVTFNELTIAGLRESLDHNVSTKMQGKDLLVEGDKKDLDLIVKGLETLKDKRNIERLSENEIKIEGKKSDLVTYDADGYDIYKNKLGQSPDKHSILEYIGLGFEEDAINQIKTIDGISVNLRPILNPDVQDTRLCMERFIDSVKRLNPEQNYVIFSGKNFFKNTENDDQIENDFAKFLKENNIGLGLVETANQRGNLGLDGAEASLKNPDIKKLRAFTTWDYLASQYDYEIPFHNDGQELTNVYYRAVSERNISVIFLSPFIKNDRLISEPEKYGQVLQGLNERVEKKGYQLKDAKTMGSWQENSFLKIPVALGSLAASLLLLEILFNLPSFLSLAIFALGALLSIMFFGLGKQESLGNILFNLNSIIVFPLLSICYILENYKEILSNKKSTKLNKILYHGGLILVISILITMIGALHEIAFMSGTNYLLEIDTFRGVKISQLLPLALSIIIFAAYIGFSEDIHQDISLKPREIRDLMTKNVKIWQAAFGLLFLAILAIFIVRGGNTNAKVPKFELFLRNLMEQNLVVRPRTKSILAGYPAIILLTYIAYTKRGQFIAAILTLFATIGMTDIVNTFSHIRTPLYISFMRVLVEIVVALLISLLILIIAELIRRGYKKHIE